MGKFPRKNVRSECVAGPGKKKACLSEHVRSALETYFANLDGDAPEELYQLVLAQVERPLLEVVLHNSGGNLTRASGMLGINRVTLRKRMKKYGLAQSVG